MSASDIAYLQRQVNDLESRAYALEQEVEFLRGALARRNDRIEALEAELDRAMDDVNDLQQEVTALQQSEGDE